ncbi:MAG: flagellar motor switch protein FliM [Rhizobiales bacterium]|nr:flagellar motor switch protein FliM [Hyphomicrobiales bacterium]
MADDDDFEDDDLAAAWGEAMQEQGVSNAETLTAQWASMMDGGDDEGGAQNSDRLMTQDEIDSLMGFRVDQMLMADQSGVRALISSALVSYERLPMLEVVFNRLVRLSTTSLRNLTSDNVEVSLDSISSVRFGDYLNSIPLPAILSVFRAEEWDNFGLITTDSPLIYSIVDVLLGGGRGMGAARVEGRPYTAIELSLVQKLVERILSDAEQAFEPVSPVHFTLDRMETNPRFAALIRPANAAVLVRFRIDMEDRGGNIEFLLPYETIEPIRHLLLQMFVGDRVGRDHHWEQHLATQTNAAEIVVDAVLFEKKVPLEQVLDLKVGQTLLLRKNPSDPVLLRVGQVTMSEGQIGRIKDRISVQVTRGLKPQKMTMAGYEKAIADMETDRK